MAGWMNRQKRGRIVSKATEHPAHEALGAASKVRATPLEGSPEFAFERGSISLEFPLLGAREYSHGSSMFEGMLASLRLLEPTLDDEGMVKRFKIVREFDSCARVVSMRRAEANRHPRLKEMAARLDLSVGGRDSTSLLFPVPKPPLGQLADYDPGLFIDSLDTASSSARIHDITDYVDLFRAINECNRLLTLNGFPESDWSRRVRLAYFEELPVLPESVCRTVSRVRFSETLPVEVGTHRFEIKQGFIEGDGFVRNFTICFFIELPGRDDG